MLQVLLFFGDLYRMLSGERSNCTTFLPSKIFSLRMVSTFLQAYSLLLKLKERNSEIVEIAENGSHPHSSS